jgi:hypothetical protein
MTKPITHRFHLPRPVAADVRRLLERPRWRERLRYREALGYLPGDREAVAEAPPATVLTALEVAGNGAATATLEPLATEEGKITAALVIHLEPDDFHFELKRDQYGDVLGMDFALSDTARRADVITALQGRAGGFDRYDAKEIAVILLPPDRDPAPAPSPRRQREPEERPVSDALVAKVRALERQQAEEQTRRNARAMGYDFGDY